MKIRLIHPAIGEFAFPLASGKTVVVGRSGPDVDVELNWDGRVSRRHAELTVMNGTLWVRDLGSRNGTWRGANQLKGPAAIEPGGTFTIGDTVISPPDNDTIDLLFDEETTPLEYIPEPDREAGYVSTMDLRKHTHDIMPPVLKPSRIDMASTPPRPPPPGNAANAAAVETRLPQGRFVNGDRLEIQTQGPAAVRALWRDHLARGGLFVEVAEMRPVYHRINVTLVSPGGSVTFPAVVVHASEPNRARSLGVPAGLGLQLNEMSQIVKSAIRGYADGLVPTLAVQGPAPAPQSLLEGDSALVMAKGLLDRLDQGDVYKALDISVDATDTAVKERIGVLAGTLSAATRHAPPAKAARIEAALLALGRLAHALGDKMRRLEHDLRHGHLRAEARIAAAKAGMGPTISELRRVWQQVAPEKVDKAAYLTRKAFTARQGGDLDEAILAARQALAENPFFDELRPTLANWEKQKVDKTELARPPSSSGVRGSGPRRL